VAAHNNHKRRLPARQVYAEMLINTEENVCFRQFDIGCQ